jgi:hypothetical protein
MVPSALIHVLSNAGVAAMRLMLRGWVIVLAVTSCAALATYLCCPGCIDRERANKNCEWADDPRFVFDSRNPAHREHLARDAQLAEELAIRYADAEFGRRTGIEHHGGLIDNGRFRNACLSRMFQAIENQHHVTPEQVQAGRGQRNPIFDLAVVLLFLPLYVLGASIACGSLFRRFAFDAPYVRLFAAALVSIAVAVSGVHSFWMWGGVWNVIRVGNGHMTSIRAASYTSWLTKYAGADFLGAVVLFWIIALVYYRGLDKGEHTYAVAEVRGIVLH